MSGGTNRADIMQKFDGFLESLKNYSMTTDTEDKRAEVQSIVSNMGYTCYRWLNYQYALDNGLDDLKLAEQQHQFVKDINSFASDLSGEELLEKPGDFVCDTVGFISNLFAYNFSSLQDETEVKQTREESRVRYEQLKQFAMDSAPIKAMMGHLSGEQSTTDSYMEMRVHQHSTAATVLRTLLVDFAMDWNWMERAGESFKEQWADTCVYLFFFSVNSEWTSDAIKWTLLSSFTYDLESKKERKETLLFIFDLVDQMISQGEKTMRSKERLTGTELLDKVRSIPKMDIWLLSVQCGYTNGVDEDGGTLADAEAFREAYLAATDALE